MSRQMTEQPVVTEKKPMPKADPTVEIPAWTKKQVMENPFTGKPQPLSWFWRKLDPAVREELLATHAAGTGESESPRQVAADPA
jgi:hypothetical protein